MKEFSNKTTFKVGEIVKAEVVDYNFDEKERFVAILRIVPDPEPFDVFLGKYKIGDTVSLKTMLYDERPGDYQISLVVQELVSGLEIVLEPEKLTFSTRGFVIKEIPLGIEIKAEVESIDQSRRRVVLSCLPILEKHLNDLIAAQRSTEGVFELDGATVGDVYQDRIFLLLPWSDPGRGLIHVVSVAGRGLYKPAENYAIGEKCKVRISLPKNAAHRSISEVPEEIKSRIEKQQREFSNLSWQDGSLIYAGRMTNNVRNNLKSPAKDRNYHRAIDDLYRFSNLLMADTIDIEKPKRMAKYTVGKLVKV